MAPPVFNNFSEVPDAALDVLQNASSINHAKKLAWPPALVEGTLLRGAVFTFSNAALATRH